MGKREEKRNELRTALIEAAEAIILRQGLSHLKARDVTKAAGCALGALYNAFADLDMLVVHVNSRTLARLGETLHKATQAVGDCPAEKLHALAAGYVDFALAERNLWLALFQHQMPDPAAIPDWHKKNHSVLIDEIIAPLSRLRPDLNHAAVQLRAQSTFAAVHGVVQFAILGKFVGVPLTHLKDEVHGLVHTMTTGARHIAQERAKGEHAKGTPR